jgi:hypothetical protein
MDNMNETNGLVDPGAYYDQEFSHMRLAEFAAKGGKITRVRFLTEKIMGARVADLSYVHGVLPDGSMVRLEGAPALYLAPWKKGVYAGLIQWAKDEGVFAKAIGLLDEANWSVMY